MTFYLKTGDRIPPIRARVVSKETGAPVDLSGATIKFSMVDVNGTAEIDGAAGVLEDGPNGLIKYEWAAGDTNNAGHYDGEFLINDGASDEFRVPANGYIKIVIGQAL